MILLMIVVALAASGIRKFSDHAKLPEKEFSCINTSPNTKSIMLLCSSLKAKLHNGVKHGHKPAYKTRIFLSILLLLLSLDIEPNPGPTLPTEYINNSTIFPCGSCEQPVTWTCQGVEYDFCNVWYHADCQNISDSMYDRLGNESKIGVWKCLLCDNLNINSSSLANLDSFESVNMYNNLANITDNHDTSKSSQLSTDSIAMFTSTPINKNKKRQKTYPTKKAKKNNVKRSLKILVVNCRSIVDKKQEYENLITSTSPDIVIGTESWLKARHYDDEIFDLLLGYTPFRRDRQEQTGGGVFIAVKNCIIAQEAPDLCSNCENL